MSKKGNSEKSGKSYLQEVSDLFTQGMKTVGDTVTNAATTVTNAATTTVKNTRELINKTTGLKIGGRGRKPATDKKGVSKAPLTKKGKKAPAMKVRSVKKLAPKKMVGKLSRGKHSKGKQQHGGKKLVRRPMTHKKPATKVRNTKGRKQPIMRKGSKGRKLGGLPKKGRRNTTRGRKQRAMRKVPVTKSKNSVRASRGRRGRRGNMRGGYASVSDFLGGSDSNYSGGNADLSLIGGQYAQFEGGESTDYVPQSF